MHGNQSRYSRPVTRWEIFLTFSAPAAETCHKAVAMFVFGAFGMVAKCSSTCLDDRVLTFSHAAEFMCVQQDLYGKKNFFFDNFSFI